jgi:NTE family protein
LIGAVTRVGLVLGAGGVVGHAFHAGVLGALADETGWDARDADLLSGTSAGSVVSALLRAGFSARDVSAEVRGLPLSDEGARMADARTTHRPEIPQRARRRRGLSFPARPFLARAALTPWLVRPGALAAAMIPEGTVPTELVAAGLRPFFTDGWPKQSLWINTVRLSDGRRVTLGREGAPETDVATAVAASCAIPGFFEPVSIDGVRYVDGGAHSPSNADVFARERDLDLVIVSSPMSIAGRSVRIAADEPVRRIARLALAREVRQLKRAGIRVLAFQPTAEEVRVMGLNAMDPARRTAVAQHAYTSAIRRIHRADAHAARDLLVTIPQP